MCNRCHSTSQLRNSHLWKIDFSLKQKKKPHETLNSRLRKVTRQFLIEAEFCLALTGSESVMLLQRNSFGEWKGKADALCCHVPFAVTSPLLHGLHGSSVCTSRGKCELFTPQLPAFLLHCFQRRVSPVFLFTFLFPCPPLQTITSLAPVGCRGSSSSPEDCSHLRLSQTLLLSREPRVQAFAGQPCPLPAFGILGARCGPDWPGRFGLMFTKQGRGLELCCRFPSVLGVPRLPVQSREVAEPQGHSCATWAPLSAWLVGQCCWAVEQQRRDRTPGSHRSRASPQLLRPAQIWATQISIAGGDFLPFL